MEYKGYEIKTVIDENPKNPRDYCLSIMACFHEKYLIGDKHGFSSEIMEEIKEKSGYVYLPIYLCEHGMTDRISHEKFPVPCSSPQIGVLFTSVFEERSTPGFEKATTDQIKTLLEGEIKHYSAYMEDKIYKLQIIKDNKVIEEIENVYDIHLSMTSAYISIDFLVEKERLESVS